MITIQILEETDTIESTDWCRPLQLMTMSAWSDGYSFKSMYSGRPENNVKWVRAKDVFGSGWFGCTIKELDATGIKYEFVRGNIPLSHQLDMREYN